MEQFSSAINRFHIYRVRRGDTLAGIARRFGVSVRELMAVNGLRNSRVFVGQRLRIPLRRPPASRPPVPPNRVYTVRRGDTLESIARMFGVGVRDIMAMNGLTHTILLPGQRLVIPQGIMPLR